MAARVGRWGAGIGLACAAIAVAFLPPREDSRGILNPDATTRRFGRDTRLPQERMRDRVNGHLMRAYVDLKDQELRLALSRALARDPLPGDAPPRVLSQGGVRIDGELGQAFRQVWASIPRGNARTAIAIVLYADSGYSRRTGALVPGLGFPRRRYILPPRLDGRTCAVVWNRRSGPSAPHEGAAEVFGPCALYAQFGLPGTHVARWLAARDYDLIWRTRPVPAPPRRWAGLLDSLTNTFFAPIARTREGISWHLTTSVVAAQCVTGDEAACRTTITDTANPSKLRLGNVILDPSNWRGPAHFAGVEESFLADVRQGEGDERFARFWASPLPVEDAFRDAFGRDIGAWTQQWVERGMGRVERGPAPRAASAVVTLLVGLGIVGAAVGMARWRRFEEPDRLSRQLGLPVP